MIKIEVEASKVGIKIWKGMTLKQIVDSVVKKGLYQKIINGHIERSEKRYREKE